MRAPVGVRTKKIYSFYTFLLFTFHCREMELLVRWWSLGEGGTSGTLQCVVKEPASEHEPRTEL